MTEGSGFAAPGESTILNTKLPGISQGAAQQTNLTVQPNYGFAVISEGRSTAPVNLRSLACDEDPTRTLYLPGNASHLPVDALK